jgi:hypothetical protein
MIIVLSGLYNGALGFVFFFANVKSPMAINEKKTANAIFFMGIILVSN